MAKVDTLNSLMRSLNLYGKLLALSVRSQLQYRSALALQILGQFVITAIEFVGLFGVFSRFGSFAQWSLAEMAFLYGLVDLSFALADALSYGFDFMGSLVRTGDFDRLLVRPVSPILQLLGKEVTLRRAGRLLEGAVIFTGACVALSLEGRAPGLAGAAMVALSAVAGVVVFMSVFLLQAAFTFVTVDGLEAVNALSYGGRQAGAYPLRGFRRWMQVLFMAVVPIGAVLYLPVATVLGKEALPGLPLWVGALGPLMALPFTGLAYLLWRMGLRRYQSGGG